MREAPWRSVYGPDGRRVGGRGSACSPSGRAINSAPNFRNRVLETKYTVSWIPLRIRRRGCGADDSPLRGSLAGRRHRRPHHAWEYLAEFLKRLI